MRAQAPDDNDNDKDGRDAVAAGAAHKHADAGEVIAVIRRILAENGRDYFWQYAFAGLCLAVVALSTAFMAWIMRDVVDQVFAERQSDMIFWICSAKT